MRQSKMVDKLLEPADAISRCLKAKQTVMCGGFGRGGTPFTLIEELEAQADKYSELTLVKNDANEVNIGIDLLFKRGMVQKLISTHIGLNPDLIQMMNLGNISCDIIPQGIFAEKIRAAGAGIPAFLHDIGLDTEYAKDKELQNFRGKQYIIEAALFGDVALIYADKVDEIGNCWWRGSNRNMCVAMASACKKVIVEAGTILTRGAIAAEDVHLPGCFIDYIVPARTRKHTKV